MQRLVRAYPIRAGRQDDVRAFAREAAANAEIDEFYEGYGVHASSWHLQEIDGRWVVIVVTDVVAPAALAASYGPSERRFDTWFKESVRGLSGVDPARDPLGPAAESIFQWRRRADV
jgi:hypothetical protein